MLTPQEVSERAFSKVSFGGYTMSQVDDFLDVLTEDYTALYNENAVLKSKMKVLVDKVEEYRSTEDAMRKALMTAQKMADEMVQQAEQKRDEILRQVEQEAQERTESMRREEAAETQRLEQAKRATAEFASQLRQLFTRQLEHVDTLEQLAPPLPPAEPVQEDSTDEAATEIDGNVQRLLAQAIVEATAEKLKETVQEEPKDLTDTAEFPAVGEPAEEEDAQETKRIDFGNLQFGRDYQIK